MPLSSKRDGETPQNGYRVRHHRLNDILGRLDVANQADALPCEPGHLLPIAFGIAGRQDHVELAQLHLLAEEYRPPDHWEIVADHWDLGKTVGPFIDHPVPQDLARRGPAARPRRFVAPRDPYKAARWK